MACDIGGGCKVCPGMWIAALILAVMAIQSLLSGSKDSAEALPVDSVSAVEQTSMQ